MSSNSMLDDELRDESAMSSELSQQEAEANLARNLAERFEAGYRNGEAEIPLDRQTTIGVLITAMKCFVESVDGVYPHSDLDRRPPHIVFRRHPR